MSEQNEKKLAGMVGFFEGPQEVLEGMEKVRDANFCSIDAFTPFPIHGMDDAQGLKRSILPYITFCAGLTGFICAFSLQYWTSVIDWPLNVGGKPLNSWPAFVPVMFELTILFSGITTVFGMFALNRLPNMTKKLFDPSITRDRFAIIIEAVSDDPDEGKKEHRDFSEEGASEVLRNAGATEIRKVYQEGWF